MSTLVASRSRDVSGPSLPAVSPLGYQFRDTVLGGGKKLDAGSKVHREA